MAEPAPVRTPPPSGRSRRVEPVSEEFSPEEVFDPESQARPGTAAVLFLGPLLAVVGVLGWVRLVLGVPLPPDPDSLPADFVGLGADFLLILLFVVPHSILARGFGKRWLNRPLGPAAERPLYVLVAGASLTLLAFAWTTTGPVLWNHTGIAEILARGVQAAGLGLAVWAALVSGAGGLLALPQLRSLESGRTAPSAELVALPPYRWLRQPMNLGCLLFLAGMPEATLDRLLLAVAFGAWILLAAAWEEREAQLQFGEAYEDYRERTPRWIPRFSFRDS